MPTPAPAFSRHFFSNPLIDVGHAIVSPHNHPLAPTGKQRKFIAGFCCQSGDISKIDILLSHRRPAVIGRQLVHQALLSIVQRTIKVRHGVGVSLARVSLFDRALYNIHALLTPHGYCTTPAAIRQRPFRRLLRLRHLHLYRPATRSKSFRAPRSQSFRIFPLPSPPSSLRPGSSPPPPRPASRSPRDTTAAARPCS